MGYENSTFDGGMIDYVGVTILAFLITACTLGICTPWAVCICYKWKIEHTIIEGRRLKFTGSAWDLFGHWIKWFLMCIITFGIYGFWVHIKIEKWKVENTTFENVVL